jgi:hypothetical protein
MEKKIWVIISPYAIKVTKNEKPGSFLHNGGNKMTG